MGGWEPFHDMVDTYYNYKKMRGLSQNTLIHVIRKRQRVTLNRQYSHLKSQVGVPTTIYIYIYQI